jgi:hypothetical protein
VATLRIVLFEHLRESEFQKAFIEPSAARKGWFLLSGRKRRKEHSMKTLATLVAVMCVAIASALPAAAADGPVKTYSQHVTLGFYRGGLISYLDFGPVKLAPGNKLAPIWVVANGPDRQRNIIDTVPGKSDYTPLWKVQMVTWKAGAAANVLRSAAAVRAAQRAGEVTVKPVPVVVNCPVL